MEMNKYNCTNPNIIHISNAPKYKLAKPEKEEIDLVQEFKKNPDSFFPSIIPPAKPH
ncbi:MAG: Spore coat associated protein JA (CotJA) [Eubacteriales bacterium]